ncbi:NcpB protein [Candidatus Moduliflexus flocculans]|uniref:NcpB protein n=1 Tax=Candidatus Moduliflexus flocculans TaxID=1499966 RepID=A0A081BS86_9BACT|nr:NcpB protein [Candidatus Moduliflexus flocculans]
MLLYRYTGQEDLLIGFPVANRHAVEFEALLGLFMNTLVLRTDLSGNPTFLELLARVRSATLTAQEHQELPFERLIAAIYPDRDPSYHPVFQSMFVFENMPMPIFRLSKVTLMPIDIFNHTAKFDCSLVLTEKEDELAGQIEYSTDLFTPQTIERLVNHFHILLKEIVAHPERRIAEIPMLTEAECRLFFQTEPFEKLPNSSMKCVHQLFEEQVERTPNAIALVFDEQYLTYQQLNRKANQLAHYLQRHGVEPETLVGICMERSFEMIIGLLGVLKAGGAYLPLVPTYPQERLAFMMQDSRMLLLLTHTATYDNLSLDRPGSVVCLNGDWSQFEGESQENPKNNVSANSLAYVIYTSGSTGVPKGVLVTHIGIPNLCAAQILAFRLSEQSRVLQMASFGFDASVSEIFTTFLAGATLVLMPQEKILPGEPLAQTLRETKISIVTLPPSVLEILEERNLPDLQTVISAGEACSAEIIQRWSAGRHFINAYGPTEATVCATMNEQVDSIHPSNIGRAIPGVALYILNSSLQPCPIGVPGELHIGGIALARGYLNQPELTAERFIPNPFSPQSGKRLYKTGDLARFLPDGTIEYLGRIDHQVKIRGFRIELGEIEAVLRQQPKIAQSVVIMREHGSRGKHLLAYIVPQSGVTISTSDVRMSLKRSLPDYMIPDVIMVLDKFPLTPNGKIDRLALPHPEQGTFHENFVAPRHPIEQILANTWAEILEIEQVGIHDNFFELGGHSLLTMKLMFRVCDIFQVKLPLRMLFEAPTIAEFAKILEAVRGVNVEDKLMHIGAVDEVAESQLDEKIRPESLELPETRFSNPAIVFLTGATGFLGAFLLAELLQKTKAQVYCLVRAATVEEGWQRLQNTLKKYALWHNGIVQDRIVPILGDLSLPRFGVSEEQFQQLACEIDMIYHNGAMVNLVYPYAGLKAANVDAAKDIIRLACVARLKPIHYISTMSVFLTAGFAKKRTVYEDTPLDSFDELIQEGYAQSKWIAEKLLEQAKERNVPVTIYRPGTISGHSVTGVWNTDDVVCSVIKGCIQLGKAPYKNIIYTYLTPVDYVSQAIMHLSQQPTSAGRVFHLVNPMPLQWNEIVDWIYDFGYPFERLSYKAWQAALVPLATARTQENALSHLLPVYLENEPDRYEPQFFDCQRTLDALTGTDITCPSIPSLLETYFANFIRTGFLWKPVRQDQGTYREEQ